MAQKLWEKSVQVNKDIERFTVGRDREMDLYLAKHWVVDKRRTGPVAGGIEEYLCLG